MKNKLFAYTPPVLRKQVTLDYSEACALYGGNFSATQCDPRGNGVGMY